MQAVLDRALSDAAVLEAGGVDGVIVENFGDVPFHPRSVPAETIAAMAVATSAVLAAVALPIGVNVLRNDGTAAMAVAAASGARFIRVNVHTGSMFTDQGLLEGRANETLRLRTSLRAPVFVLADVFVKHGTPPPGVSLEGAARDTYHRGLADGLIFSGTGTGAPTRADDLARVRAVLPEAPLWVGSGVTAETARDQSRMADGLIVGSDFQQDGVAGLPVDPARVARFMGQLRSG